MITLANLFEPVSKLRKKSQVKHELATAIRNVVGLPDESRASEMIDVSLRRIL